MPDSKILEVDPAVVLDSSDCFFCPYLRATMKKQACADRQRPGEMSTYFGRKVYVHNTPQDRHCRSGKCGLGRYIRRSLKRLRLAARRAGVKVPRKPRKKMARELALAKLGQGKDGKVKVTGTRQALPLPSKKSEKKPRS